MSKIDLSKLTAPTPESEIKHREQAGKTLSYIDARYCMDTLDEVCGPGNWCDNYKEVKGLMMCGVSIFVNGVWVTKWDTGSEANFEKEKSIVSDSFKRACVKWGIGRDLYKTKKAGRNATPNPQEASSSDGTQPISSRDYIITFGKHSGKKISEIPTDYIQWYLSQSDKKEPELTNRFKLEIAGRKKQASV